jgi:hypothetical protein
MPKKSKGDQLLSSRKDMIRAPQRAAIHVNEEGMIILTFSDDSGESHSFLLSQDLAGRLSDGLGEAVTITPLDFQSRTIN